MVPGFMPQKTYWYETSRPGQLSLAISLSIDVMSRSTKAGRIACCTVLESMRYIHGEA